jgi:hypothetical protein
MVRLGSTISREQYYSSLEANTRIALRKFSIDQRNTLLREAKTETTRVTTSRNDDSSSLLAAATEILKSRSGARTTGETWMTESIVSVMALKVRQFFYDRR